MQSLEAVLLREYTNFAQMTDRPPQATVILPTFPLSHFPTFPLSHFPTSSRSQLGQSHDSISQYMKTSSGTRESELINLYIMNN
eukprot:SAG31_NODE_3579_length_4102_cov_3.565326_5_plen_84_part_00